MVLPIPDVSEDVLQRTDDIRHELHRRPELSLQEFGTAKMVADRLRELKLDEVREGVGGTGVVGLLRGPEGSRTVALRADMDGLPIMEETGLEWASQNAGVMHACGHDGHVAVLLGVVELLAARRDELPGTVKFIFQPGEEGAAGAKLMVDDGVLRDPDVDAIFAFHGTPKGDAGRVFLRDTMYAAMKEVHMVVRGSGGHGARPHRTIDPIVTAAQIIVAAQTVVSREVPPDQPSVLSFGSIHGGTRDNVIPDEVVVRGTIRAMRQDIADGIHASLERVAVGVAQAMRATVEITAGVDYPPVINDLNLLEFVRTMTTEVVGADNVIMDSEQQMGAEDFAFYMPEQGGVRGAIFRMGTGCHENLHTSRFDFGSAALKPAILSMANIAWRFCETGGV